MSKYHPGLTCLVFLCFALVALADSPRDTLMKSLVTTDYFNIPADYFGKTFLSAKDINGPNVKDGVYKLTFGSKPQNTWIYFDVKKNFDLSETNLFYMDAEIVEKDAPVPVPFLAFHTGNGWYLMSGKPQVKLGTSQRRYEFAFGGAARNDEPGTLDKVDCVRVAFSKCGDRDLTFKVDRIFCGRTVKLGVLQIKPGDWQNAEFFNKMCIMLNNANIPYMTLSSDKLPDAATLKNYSALLIPLGTNMSPETVDRLCEYLDNGGFIISCFLTPEKLMNKMGFQKGKYIPCLTSNIKVREVVFTQDAQNAFTPFLPAKMKQTSNYIVVSQPLEETTDPYFAKEENRPRIMAWWHDEKGNKTELPAMVRSGRGVYFSHVVLPDNIARKEKFLYALAATRCPECLPRLLCRQWRSLFELGYPGWPVGENEFAKYKKDAPKILDLLEQRQWSATRILNLCHAVEAMKESNTVNQVDRTELGKFLDVIGAIRTDRAQEYLRALPDAPGEVHLCWENSGLGPWPGDWDRTMKFLSEVGITGIVVNMIWAGSAYYESSVLPVADVCRQYGDQVKLISEAGKKYGVETHIWKYNLRLGSGTPKEFTDKIAAEKRFQVGFDGKTDENLLCPSHPANQKLEIDAMLEVSDKYDITGIHFDFIRYPDANHCFCDGCRERFSKYLAEKSDKRIEHWPADVRKDPEIAKHFTQWRCDQITFLVKSVHDVMAQRKHKVKISAAVFRNWPDCRVSVGQDWVMWCKNGWLDFVCPMNYTDVPDVFDASLKTQMAAVQGKARVYPGIGATYPQLQSIDRVADQIKISRKYKTGGFCIYGLTLDSIDTTFGPLRGTPFARPANTR
ncbi:MAG: family 10 glycosylhydrolase [Thermoguttaceae bacterium]|nr:family 10 glycosylhydrolase [Thermoguttaceae bacterium]